MFSPEGELSDYDYELIYVDDYSPDNTRVEIEKICGMNPKAKAVFNAKNFGYTRNVFQSLKYGSGDATFMLFGDLQDPPELLPEFVKRWENGKKVIIGQKIGSRESKVLYFLRTVYYRVIKSLSPVQQIQHFNGYGLYDRDFIEVIKSIDDPQPYLKGIVGEFAMKQDVLQYQQAESLRGKSNTNFAKAYDAAMVGITSYTKSFMRVATFIGALLGIFSGLFALYIFLSKLLGWSDYPFGTASIIVGVFFIGAVQLFFTGILGEYILSINTRTMRRPLVVVERFINFEEEDETCKKHS